MVTGMRDEGTEMKVATYRMIGADWQFIREATKVTFPDGVVVRFTWQLPEHEAVRQARELRARQAGR
jgi:hypothetical protein